MQVLAGGGRRWRTSSGHAVFLRWSYQGVDTTLEAVWLARDMCGGVNSDESSL